MGAVIKCGLSVIIEYENREDDNGDKTGAPGQSVPPLLQDLGDVKERLSPRRGD